MADCCRPNSWRGAADYIPQEHFISFTFTLLLTVFPSRRSERGADVRVEVGSVFFSAEDQEVLEGRERRGGATVRKR